MGGIHRVNVLEFFEFLSEKVLSEFGLELSINFHYIFAVFNEKVSVVVSSQKSQVEKQSLESQVC